MKRILLKSCALAAGLTLGCFEKPTPVYGVPDTGYLAQDSDGDGWSVDDDCDDDNAEVNPDAEEICDDGIDNDCDDAIDDDDEDCVG